MRFNPCKTICFLFLYCSVAATLNNDKIFYVRDEHIEKYCVIFSNSTWVSLNNAEKLLCYERLDLASPK